jgi:hypothetical protein
MSLIYVKLAEMMSVIPSRFSSKAETSLERVLPNILSISGLIELINYLTSRCSLEL